ncbi:ATP-binding protein [Dethiobacter alkaliphilus]|uniref:ATP-binding protein n=1 Tax=Dethiobacter alkaliphilus TaxID=427926 RepID=UPI0022264869|nr:ATP-binding protein [Dethiobacter alkaliphilus]MCW3491717.1 ATP-binding protein [Dethiobacter alkaliphilus]
MELRVCLFIGIPASGKSSWAQKLLRENPKKFSYLSSDEVRESVFGDVADMSHNALVFQIMKDRMVTALENERSVILDATFVKASERQPFIQLAKELEAQVMAYYIKTDLGEALQRNENRKRKVPPEVIRQRLKDVEEPEPAEGFDRIVTIDSKVGIN